MKPRSLQTLILMLTLALCTTPQQDGAQTENYNQDEQQNEFSRYSEHLGDFTPIQSFQFHLQASQQQTFIYWPTPEKRILRGMFYITSDENKGLFLGIEHEDKIQKSFWDKKIGVFSVPYVGSGDMKIICKSELKELKVYLSYEFVDKKKVEKIKANQGKLQNQNSQQADGQPSDVLAGQQQSQENKLPLIVQNFTDVKNTLLGQRDILRSIVRTTMLQAERLKRETNTKSFRVILETLVIVVSGVVSIWMLKAELRKGYELIV